MAAMACEQPVPGAPQQAEDQWAQQQKQQHEQQLQLQDATEKGDGQEKAMRRKRKKKKKSSKTAKDAGLLDSFCALVCEHQIGLSINLLLLLVLAHVSFPRARPTTTKFLAMSYYNAATEQYGAGIDDLHFAVLWIVLFTGLRAAAMDYVLFPLARAGGVRTNKDCVRFAEQAWLLLYYCVLWPVGMYIMYNSGYWLDLKALWTTWPSREMDGLSKWYYLVQLAFWLQQFFVINVEEKRKDYAQMLTHHIFTAALLFTSYGSYNVKVGTMILCLMDVVDLIFPVAKLLKYLDYRTAPDIAFGIFMAVWVVARHGFYLTVCWSLYVDLSVIVGSACHLADGTSMTAATQPDLFAANGGHRVWRNILHAYLDRDGPVCFNTTIRWSFLSLLLGLQVITLLWLIMIFKVAFRVLRGEAADDIRSDDEATEDVEDALGSSEDSDNAAMLQAGDESLVPLEQEVGVESLTFPRCSSPGLRRSAASRGGASRSSGISIPGHGDRKELLGRIGCDKPS